MSGPSRVGSFASRRVDHRRDSHSMQTTITTPRTSGLDPLPPQAIIETAQTPTSPGPWPDIGHLAKWSVSSYKFGFGPECLRDDDPETFWQ